MGVQRKVGISGDREIIDRKGVQRFGSFDLRRNGLGTTKLG
jgi:hypothetical protein